MSRRQRIGNLLAATGGLAVAACAAEHAWQWWAVMAVAAAVAVSWLRLPSSASRGTPDTRTASPRHG